MVIKDDWNITRAHRRPIKPEAEKQNFTVP